MSKSAIITIIAAVLLVVFAVQNSEVASLKLFFWEIQMSLALMLLFLFILGAGFGYFFHILVLRRKKKRAQLEKQEFEEPDSINLS